MTKIVICARYGEFLLKQAAFDLYLKLKPESSYKDRYELSQSVERTDPILVQVVEELGCLAGFNSVHDWVIVIVEIPDGVNWQIVNDHGREVVHEVHRTWQWNPWAGEVTTQMSNENLWEQ